jgi:hypothetical protein
MSLDDITHCLLQGNRSMEIAKVTTVIRTAKELIETITVQLVTLSSSEFLRCFANIILDYALIFNKFSSEPGSSVPVLSNAWT